MQWNCKQCYGKEHHFAVGYECDALMETWSCHHTVATGWPTLISNLLSTKWQNQLIATHRSKALTWMKEGVWFELLLHFISHVQRENVHLFWNVTCHNRLVPPPPAGQQYCNVTWKMSALNYINNISTVNFKRMTNGQCAKNLWFIVMNRFDSRFSTIFVGIRVVQKLK